jgi:chromosome segregation ATPase
VENLEKLIVDLKESLERELAGLRHDVQQAVVQLNGRFDTQAARLERHAGLWQTGARWSSRMDAWAEKVDAALEAKDHEIAELRERLQRLERRSA